jgi:hypothetical protein
MNDDLRPFTCPRCGYHGRIFHQICPECGRPYFRDYQDTQIHPRDPEPQGIYKGKFRAFVFLVLLLIGLAISILASFHIILEQHL